MGVSKEGRFGAAGYFDLGHEVGQVCFDGAFGYAQPSADLAIVDVIELWSGGYACLLQSALRLTNEQFATRLGIAVRTVATWHSDAAVVPRREMQQLLDTTHEQAPATARRRLTLLVAAERAPTASPPAGAQALRVAIAVVVRDVIFPPVLAVLEEQT